MVKERAISSTSAWASAYSCQKDILRKMVRLDETTGNEDVMKEMTWSKVQSTRRTAWCLEIMNDVRVSEKNMELMA